MANSTLTTLTAVLQMNNSNFKKGLSSSEKALNYFKKQVAFIGTSIAAAFSVRAVVNFAKESAMLAGQMQGVAIAFERIRPNKDFLEDLKKATHGTVTELELMKRSVMAANFKIPLEDLGTLLTFATKRAQETGESVDYLVDSIVKGIGRKSPLILDNLGISAVELREKLKGVGMETASVMDIAKAVGEIARDSLKETGDVVQTSALYWEQLKTKIQDAKEELGKFLLGQTEIDKQYRSFLEWWRSVSTLGGMGPGIDDTINKLQNSNDLLSRAFYQDNPDEIEETMRKIDAYNKSLVRSAKDYKTLDIKNLFTSTSNVFTQDFGLNNLFELSFAISELDDEVKILKADLLKLPEGFDAAFGTMQTINGEDVYTPGNVLQTMKWERAPALSTPSPIPGRTMEELAALSGLQAGFDELENSIQESLGDETFGKIDMVENAMDSLGKNIGLSLISQFDQLGVAIGEFASGSADALNKLGQAILQNLGNLLIMAGAQTGNIPLMLLGAGLQLGGGLIKGLGNKANGGPMSRNNDVNFRIQGKDLVGSLSRYNISNSQNT